MFFNRLFSKTAPAPSFVGTLTHPFRTENKPVILPKKAGPKRPVKIPPAVYALASFLSVILAGVSADALSSIGGEYVGMTPVFCAIAFLCAAVASGWNAALKWKH